jgi:hypothetical protein
MDETLGKQKRLGVQSVLRLAETRVDFGIRNWVIADPAADAFRHPADVSATFTF